jgi:hypothetical protein
MVLSDISTDLPGVAAAAIPGIIVALLTYWLTTRRANLDARQATANARALLALEMGSNADTLRRYWDQIHRLDKDFVPGAPMTDEQLTAHLAAMALAGWVSGQYPTPRWSVIRWEGFPASALGGLSDKQLAEVDAGYRDLRAFGDEYTKMVFISPEERGALEANMGGRFWHLRFAESRVEMYKRVDALARRVMQNQPLRAAN